MDVLTVSGTVVTQIFPTKQDLPWLSHVREVDLTDTELALGDDDGWLAVVLANRLPQPGMRYTACLVSLEGHGDDLPAKEVSATSFSKFSVYSQAQINAAAIQQRQSETLVDGAAAQMFGGGHAASAAPSPGLGAAATDVTLVGARQPAIKAGRAEGRLVSARPAERRDHRPAGQPHYRRIRHRPEQRCRAFDQPRLHRSRGAHLPVHRAQALVVHLHRRRRLRVPGART